MVACVAPWLQADYDSSTARSSSSPSASRSTPRFASSSSSSSTRSNAPGPGRWRAAPDAPARRRCLGPVLAFSDTRPRCRREAEVPCSTFRLRACRTSRRRTTLGRFEVEPLDRGFGHTFGNSLAPRAALVPRGRVGDLDPDRGRPARVQHHRGRPEDVTDIILNLRGLVCVLHGETREIEVEISKVGPGPGHGRRHRQPADLEILNPELEMANLLPGARLEMILTIARGRRLRGGRAATRGRARPIGVIPVDSASRPVRRVRYEVSSARVGQRTDYDKLTLEIETDGSRSTRATPCPARPAR